MTTSSPSAGGSASIPASSSGAGGHLVPGGGRAEPTPPAALARTRAEALVRAQQVLTIAQALDDSWTITALAAVAGRWLEIANFLAESPLAEEAQ